MSKEKLKYILLFLLKLLGVAFATALICFVYIINKYGGN